MSHSSEERLQDSSPSPSKTARILPFERPPTNLQRAVQARAQEALERDRERSRGKPAPLRWAVMFLLALIPVGLLFAGVDAFVRAFHRINETYSKMPAPNPAPEQVAPVQESPSEPGVVMLQPLEAQPQAEAAPQTPPAQPQQ